MQAVKFVSHEVEMLTRWHFCCNVMVRWIFYCLAWFLLPFLPVICRLVDSTVCEVLYHQLSMCL